MLKIKLENFVPTNENDIYDDWDVKSVKDEAFVLSHVTPNKDYKIIFRVTKDGSHLYLYKGDKLIKSIGKRFESNGTGYVRVKGNRVTDKIITFMGTKSSELLDEFGIEYIKTFEKGNNYNFIITQNSGKLYDSNKELIVPVGAKFSLHDINRNKKMTIHVDDIPILVYADNNSTLKNIFNVTILDAPFVIFNEYIHNKSNNTKHIKRVLVCHKGYNILNHKDELEKIKDAGLLNDRDGYKTYE